MSNKEIVMEMLRKLPDEATLEEISKAIAALVAERRGETASVSGPAASSEKGKRIPGLHPGSIWISEDFDDPLPDEFWCREP
jgi:hypothetical protein